MRRSSRLLPSIFVALGWGASTGALAQPPAPASGGPSDTSSSHPVSLHVGLGPAIGIPGGGAFGRLPLDVQYHLRGGDVGPALGFQAPFHFDRGVVGMNLGPVFAWDFRVGALGGAKLYLGPLAATGYGFTSVPSVGATGHFWFLTLGAQFRMLWNDTIGLFVRPTSFDLWVGNGWAAGNWSFTAGLAAAF